MNKKQRYLFPAGILMGLGAILIIIGLVGSRGKDILGIGLAGWGAIGIICLVAGLLLLLRYSRLS